MSDRHRQDHADERSSAYPRENDFDERGPHVEKYSVWFFRAPPSSFLRSLTPTRPRR
jgi:hypothetical protein